MQKYGVKIKPFRILIVLISSILMLSYSFFGPVAFIGLAVPHISRTFIKTSDNRILIPGESWNFGAIVTLCDLISRTIFAQQNS